MSQPNYISNRDEYLEDQHQCDYSSDYYFESEMFYYEPDNVWVAIRFIDEWLLFVKEFMLQEDFELLTNKLKK